MPREGRRPIIDAKSDDRFVPRTASAALKTAQPVLKEARSLRLTPLAVKGLRSLGPRPKFRRSVTPRGLPRPEYDAIMRERLIVESGSRFKRWSAFEPQERLHFC